MLIGTAIGTTGLVAAAFMPSAQTLFAALLVFGLGSAVVPVAGTGALFTVYPPARRGWALGIRQTAVPLGGTIAAVTYPGLFALGGVEVTMLGSAVVLAATGIAFAVVTGDDRTPAASRKAPPVTKRFSEAHGVSAA